MNANQSRSSKRERIERNDTDYDAATRTSNPKKFTKAKPINPNEFKPISPNEVKPIKEKAHFNYPETNKEPEEEIYTEVTDLEGFNRPSNEPRERE